MIVGVVLAAGASTRAGFPKALATLDGETFVSLVVDHLSACDDVIVVVAAPHEEAVRREVARCVTNPHPERGMLSSLKVALEATPEADAWIVALVDHPRVRRETIDALIVARRGGAAVVRPVFAGRRGHPYLVGRELRAALLDGDDTLGARPVLARAKCVDVEVDDPAIHEDLDTREAIERAGARAPNRESSR